jgi:L-ascorbate metabolism protein UlaG (beta-lactamase superfamily)
MNSTFRINLTGVVPPEELDRGSVKFIGTATMLIRCGGFTLLTDPNFLHAGDHAHLGYGMTSRRLTNPSIEIGELPPLDVCVLSHMHGDHWDDVARDRLPKSLPVITTPGAERTLKSQGFSRAIGLKRWNAVEAQRASQRLRVTAMPGQHGPTLVNALLPEVMGSMIEWFGSDDQIRYRMYISGDTLLVSDLAEIPRRYPNIDLGLFHLGGTRLFGVLLTMDAREGIKAINLIHPDLAIPIHYNDYSVFKSPLEEFMKAVAEAGLDKSVRYLRHGDTYEFALKPTAAARPMESSEVITGG